MVANSQDERERLEHSVAALEAQRAILGDAVVDASVAVLREKLTTLVSRSSEQQRKQITVLFADVSGFTALAETLDAEDLTEVMNALWQRLDETITNHGGVVDKHIGDGIMALWGSEQAREDDPEWAVRAALAMQAELAAFRREHDVALAMRIGINTGPVLLGTVGTTAEYTAMGDTVNSASRLEKAAPVGGVLIASDTHQQVRGLFDVERLDPLWVKGKSEPLQTYQVKRARPRGFRRENRGVEGISTTMVGREAELARLRDLYAEVVEERVRLMATLVGEPGVGKSRLLAEFEAWLDGRPEESLQFRGRASQEMQHQPFSLLRNILALRFAIQESDGVAVVRRKIEEGIEGQLAGDGEAAMKAHFIGQWLGFNFSDSPHLAGSSVDAQQLHDRGLLYLCHYFHAAAEATPTLLFLEDIHWADESSLDALSDLAHRLPRVPLLVVGLARPSLLERRPHWGEGEIFHTHLFVRPLSRRESRRLVADILQRVTDLPSNLRDLVVDGAEGNPYYIEELIRMLIEEGVIVKGEGAWRFVSQRLAEVKVPSTLTAVVQARLDCLPAGELRVLQRASVVGRIFWDAAVAHVDTEVPGEAVDREVPEVLIRLREREMVYQRERSAFAAAQEYLFKHAVLREVTYESVLRRQRRVFHRLAADWLIHHAGERMDEFMGLIGDHLALAGESERAATYLGRAGERAAARYANAEAVAYFTRALQLLPEQGPQRYALLLAREKVHALRGDRAAQTEDLSQLAVLADALDDPARRAEVSLRRARLVEAAGQYQEAMEHARVALELARAGLVPRLEGECLEVLGLVSRQLGAYEGARGHLEEALAICRAIGDRSGEGLILSNLGSVFWYRGDYGEAQAHYERSLQIRREMGDRPGEGRTLGSLGAVFWYRGEYAEAVGHLKQALEIFREIGDRRGEAAALTNLGEGALAPRDYAGARAYFEQALQIFREIGDRQGEGSSIAGLGNVLWHRGEYADARGLHQQARQIFQAIGDPRSEALAVISLGAGAAVLGDYAGARAHFEEALQVFRELGDPNNEVECLNNLSWLHHITGDHEKALQCGHQALGTAREIGGRPSQGEALTRLGDALTALGRWDEALSAYQEALSLQQEMGQSNLARETLAGQAHLAELRGDPAQARTHVEQILALLVDHPAEGTFDPLGSYLTCYRILQADQDPRALQILEKANRILQQRAAQIGDEDARAAYMQGLPSHRALSAAWEQRSLAAGAGPDEG